MYALFMAFTDIVKLLTFSGLENLKRNSMVRSLNKWGPGFNLKFDINVTKITNKWHNLLHFTTEEDSSRVPGLWLNSQNGKPIIQLSIENKALIGKIEVTRSWLDSQKGKSIIEMTVDNKTLAGKI